MTEKQPTYIDGVGWRYETQHTMTRRMMNHDYQSRCIYMITMSVEDRRALLGNLTWQSSLQENVYLCKVNYNCCLEIDSENVVVNCKKMCTFARSITITNLVIWK